MVFEPLDFIARLAALVPKPRVHLIRFHGVFAPNSKQRPRVTGDTLEKQNQLTVPESPASGEERRSKMSWAMRLKRVFNSDITVCRYCQGTVKVIACIEERQVIDKILAHINKLQSKKPATAILEIRAPPPVSMSAA